MKRSPSNSTQAAPTVPARTLRTADLRHLDDAALARVVGGSGERKDGGLTAEDSWESPVV
jgi:hypothetical protein